MKYNFLEKNPHLQGKSDAYIMAQDYTLLNGIKKAVKEYNNETGVKIFQKYSYEDNKGRITDSIVNTFEDILDKNGKFLKYKITHIWVRNKVSNLVKEEILDLSIKEISDLQIGRRNNVKTYLYNEAEKSENPLIPPLFSLIFKFLQLELNIWIQTGDFSHLYKKIDDAPTTNDTNIIALFEGAKNTPTSMAQVFELEVEKDLIEKDVVVRKMKIHEYLKFYIK